MSDADLDRYRAAARILHDVAKPMRVLGALAWDGSLREAFLAGGATALPEPTYAPIDPAPVLDGIAEARRMLDPGHPIDDWLADTADSLGSTAHLLASLGTPEFHRHSVDLYGLPTTSLVLDPATPLALAERVQSALVELTDSHLLRPAVRDQTGPEVAAFLEAAVREHFGDDAPIVELADELSANALATASRIRVRRDAMFTRTDAVQLLNHEAFIHVATAKNGQAQHDLPILAIGHPGTTRTQEGLAVYSEYVSGTIGLDRLRRLADRVLAVQMVCDGADFIELYRWFLDRSPSEEQAFESTRRIFRGAPLTGGYAFTKDCGYLSGYLRIAVFVKSVFVAGRTDLLGLLFAGKLDLRAIPALAHARALGICRPARFLPTWALDPSWVLSHVTLQTFQARVDLDHVAAELGRILDQCPKVDIRFPDADQVGAAG